MMKDFDNGKRDTKDLERLTDRGLKFDNPIIVSILLLDF